MKFEIKHKLTKPERIGILRLWNSEYPKQLVHENLESLELYLASLKNAEHVVVKDTLKNVHGWLVRFERDEANWFAIIISRAHQSIGVGSQLMELLPRDETIFGWVLTDPNHIMADGENYKLPYDFYHKLGFQMEERITLSKDGINSVRIVRAATI
ncbi:MAG: GNAT superfamily N-acetyltransferase [Flavobacteriales bacterium]|jgi:GNAT superfamily N-acetyltransferase